MTMREISILAMQEIGFSQVKIDKVIAEMESKDPKLIRHEPIPVPEQHWPVAIEKAKEYFLAHSLFPEDN